MHDTNWTPQLVAEYYFEAVSTLKKLPHVTVQGYFNSCYGIVHTPAELARMEHRPTRLKATPDAISRLETALTWLRWLTVRERKLIWKRAAGVPWKMMCIDFRCSRTTLWRQWMNAVSKISDKLND